MPGSWIGNGPARDGRWGDLHGLPISLKDCFRIKGYDTSVGVASLCFRRATANAALVDQLLAMGAVLYCKTNVPQTMMALDSHNNVFGRTLNPANTALTVGGSSGGEGALVALRGSVLGVGTDVGGSIRIPCACNALYGIKPSHGRVPYAGQETGSKPGSSKLGIEATAGPIATTLRDCELFLRAVANNAPEKYDPDVIAQTWLQQSPLDARSKPLRVGIVRTDGHVRPLPVIERLMDDVARTLRASHQAVEVVEVDASPILARVLKTFVSPQAMSSNECERTCIYWKNPIITSATLIPFPLAPRLSTERRCINRWSQPVVRSSRSHG